MGRETRGLRSVGTLLRLSLFTIFSGEERKCHQVQLAEFGVFPFILFMFLFQRGLEGTIPYITTDYNFKLPGASEKIGARETEETCEEKVHPKPKLYRRIN